DLPARSASGYGAEVGSERSRSGAEGHGGRREDCPLELLVSVAQKLTTYPLPPSGSVSIGRTTENDVAIDDPSVSRRHAILHVGPPLRIEDQGSANGIRVREPASPPRTATMREVKVAPGETTAFRVGDGIVLGSTLLVVRHVDAPERPGEGGVVIRDPA